MKVLVVCEYSGRTRDAFIRAGFDAMSCDLLATEVPGPHYQGDCRDILDAEEWDLLIAHPDCTYLTCSAEWAYGDGPYHQKVKPGTLVGPARREARQQALDFVRLILNSRAKRKCLENPAVGAINKAIRRPDQIIQPNQFGHDASKATGLWLEKLPRLVPTKYIEPRWVCCGQKLSDGVWGYGCPNCKGVKVALPRWGNQTDGGQNKLTPGPDRWKERARTYEGWSNTMADQWGRFLRQSR